jgi:glycosyltransferase involved in cell wall biosynthesis
MNSTPISVIIPVRNEGSRILDTVQSIVSGRSSQFPLQLVIVDDGSTDGACDRLHSVISVSSNVILTVRKLGSSHGIPYARNRGAEAATYPIYFITDGNTIFPRNWDLPIRREFRSNRILAGTIADTASDFRGYGCTLILPSMGTSWIAAPASSQGHVPVSACSCTVIDRRLFHHLGGYDESLPIYGAAEPEFSLRAWLHGYEIVNVPDLVIHHRFRPKVQFDAYRASIKRTLVRNYVRFSCYYLPEDLLMRAYGHYAAAAPEEYEECLAERIPQSAWRRREELSRLPLDFNWFARKFNLTSS